MHAVLTHRRFADAASFSAICALDLEPLEGLEELTGVLTPVDLC